MPRWRLFAVLALLGCIPPFASNPAPPHGLISTMRSAEAPPASPVYQHDFDQNGVLFLLGTMPPLPPLTQPGQWFNPAMLGRVKVHCGEKGYLSFDGFDREMKTTPLDKELVIDRSIVANPALFRDGWFALELPAGFALMPTHYTLRNGGGTVAAVMTGWVLEGAAFIEGPWQTLDHRGCSKNVMPMHEHQCCVFSDLAATTDPGEWPHHSATFEISQGQQVSIGGELHPTAGHNNQAYRVFRVRLLQNRIAYSKSLYLQGFEIYGQLLIPQSPTTGG